MAGAALYGLGEYVFPRGWFVVGLSDQVTGKPQGVRWFGRELALYRGESGRVVMLDAYCPHMHTNIARNETSFVVRDGVHVEGDSIRCPLHAWRFGPDGRCNDIPYYKGPIPEAAKLRSWPVEERYGMVLAWHDPEGGDPDFALTPLPEWDDPSWIRWQPEDLGRMETHPIEVLDNMADIGHFGPVHGLGQSFSDCVKFYENDIRGVFLHQRQRSGLRGFPPELLQASEGIYSGPGVLFTRIGGAGPEVVMLAAHTPIDDGVIGVFFGMMVRAGSASPTVEERDQAKAIVAMFRGGFVQDFEIWQHKEPCAHPLQIRTDGPFDKVRGWYRQFYDPRVRAAEFHTRYDGLYQVPGTPPYTGPVPPPAAVDAA